MSAAPGNEPTTCAALSKFPCVLKEQLQVLHTSLLAAHTEAIRALSQEALLDEAPLRAPSQEALLDKAPGALPNQPLALELPQHAADHGGACCGGEDMRLQVSFVEDSSSDEEGVDVDPKQHDRTIASPPQAQVVPEKQAMQVPAPVSALRPATQAFSKVAPAPGALAPKSALSPNFESGGRGGTSTPSSSSSEAEAVPRGFLDVDGEAKEVFRAYEVWARLASASKRQSAETMRISRAASRAAFGEDDDSDHAGSLKFARLNEMMKRFIVQPNSPGRLCWDLMGFVMLIYDLTSVPLQLFDPPENTLTLVATWITRIFWTLDMPFSLLTGYLEKSGQVVDTFTSIAWIYLRSWFLLDLALVTYDWVSAVSSLQIMRILRVLRLCRLYRLTKVESSIFSMLYKCQSEVITIVLSLVRMMIMFFVLSHFIGCLWYGVAVNSDPQDNWVITYSLDDKPIGHRYAAALHWAVTQCIGSSAFYPVNHIERSFSLVVLFAAFVLTASAVGSITTSMTRLQFLAGQKNQQLTRLKLYLQHNSISGRLAARVHRGVHHAMAEQKRHTPEHEVELLKLVSEPLRMELHHEVYAPAFDLHPFLKQYNSCNPAAMRQVCHQAVSHVVLARHDVLFAEGEVPAVPKMHFVRGGTLQYLQEEVPAIQLREGTWVGEPCMWGPWSYCGTIKAASDCTLLCLHATDLQNIAEKFKAVEYCPGLYAQRYIARLNSLDRATLTDIYDPRINIYKLVKGMAPVDLTEEAGNSRTTKARASLAFTKMFATAGRKKSQEVLRIAEGDEDEDDGPRVKFALDRHSTKKSIGGSGSRTSLQSSVSSVWNPASYFRRSTRSQSTCSKRSVTAKSERSDSKGSVGLGLGTSCSFASDGEAQPSNSLPPHNFVEEIR